MGCRRAAFLSHLAGDPGGIVTFDVILDANIIVSAQLVQHPLAPSFRLFEASLGGALRNHISDALRDEYLDVLLRPTIMRRHGFSLAEVRELVDLVRHFSLEIAPPQSVAVAPDVRDQHLWDMLAAYPHLKLVTGDPPLVASGDFPGRILSPRDFVDQFLST